ncbi:MAG: hypothetical protein GY865_04505 [candidate division Zixibacteria bacterium]|nr:hypothetical protein [candidate division Zixibacteria bacterium]
MIPKSLNTIKWFVDKTSIERNEPGIVHSYIASLATALNYKTDNFDPIWLMGASGFAFRIWINEMMCPSAMSIFDFKTILSEAIKQSGFHNQYYSRLWNEEVIEEEVRLKAHASIIDGLENNSPAIVWDLKEAEWGLIIGYDKDRCSYSALSNTGEKLVFPYNKLGKNGIDILSVAIPTKPNESSKDEVISNSLKTAVAHAEQNEWTERPKYQNGLLAYDMWSQIFDRWALLVESGGIKNIGVDLVSLAKYYSSHYFSARCYARDYLRKISNGNKNLIKAAEFYDKVAENLLEVWKQSPDKIEPEITILKSISQNITNAKLFESDGIGYIKKYFENLNKKSPRQSEGL